MTTLQHPLVADLRIDRPEAEASRWEAAGWRRLNPAPVARKTGSTKTRRRGGDDGEVSSPDK